MDDVKNQLVKDVAELKQLAATQLTAERVKEIVKETVKETLEAATPPPPIKRRPFRLAS